MLNINDFILYLPMNDNLTDYSRNAYTVTNSGASKTTGKEGISNTAYSFDGSSNYMTLTSTVNQAIATAIGSSVTIMYDFYSDVTKLAGVISCYYNSTQNSFQSQIGSDNTVYFSIFSGASGEFDNQLTYSATTWTKIAHTMASSTAYTGYKDINTTVTKTYSTSIKTDSTGLVNIGRRGDGNYLDGKLANVIVMDRPITKLEQKYINKFGNRKRVA